MKKNVLIPTDFSIASLNVLKAFLNERNDNIRYDVVLLHKYHLSSSITEMLFMSKNRIIQSLTSNEFNEACHVIKNKFGETLNSIQIDLFTGFTQAAFENYTEAHHIELACISNDIRLKDCSDLLRYIKKSTLTITEVNCVGEGSLDFQETNQNITAVFGVNPIRMSANS